MGIRNYHEAQGELFTKLDEYLEEHGINTEVLFSCISPDHNDKTPSCSLHPNKQIFHCFGCGISGNIFHAANFLEDKSLVGHEFIEENLKYLAVKYNIEVEGEPLSDEQLYELDTYKAYRTAADLIQYNKANDQYIKVLEERGWTREICQEYGVGCVRDYKEFRERLKRFGFAASFLDDTDLSRTDIFGEDRLVFTIRDHHGRPVGFASRNLSYDGTKSNGSKYCNQKHTGIKCNIYRKSERLFGLDRVLKNRKGKKKTNTQVYVFEGYSDVVTAALHDMKNCVALGGTAFTPEQVSLLKERNLYDLVLCLDGDEAGQKRTAEILDSSLSGHKDLKVSVVIIPSGMDPDEFLRQEGSAKFKKLKKWTAFEWRLSQFDPEADDETICNSMIPLIVNEPSYIAQEKMCKTLAKHTGTSLRSIQSELNRLQNVREAQKSRERDVIIERMSRSIHKDSSNAEYAMHEAQGDLFDLARKYDEDGFSEDSVLARLDNQKAAEEAKDGSFSGYILGDDLKNFQDALCGDWKKDVWFCFGGQPNSGKTSFLSKLTYAIAKHEENNAIVIYHSIDDTAEQVIPKFVCIAENSNQMTLNQVMDPNYHLKNGAPKDVADRRLVGYATVRELVKNGRIIVKDSTDGKSIAYADSLIKYYRQKFPDRNIVYVLDNFHKLHDFGGTGDERVRFKKVSNIMKDMATKYHITILATVEYKKILPGNEPTNADIGETGQIEYDANLVAHIYNEYHEKGEAAAHVHSHDYNDGSGTLTLPRLSLKIGKNKVTGWKNKMWFDFYPESSNFRCLDEKQVFIDSKVRKDNIAEGMADKRADYFSLVQEGVEKNWKETAANVKYKDTYGEWPPREWQVEVRKGKSAA